MGKKLCKVIIPLFIILSIVVISYEEDLSEDSDTVEVFATIDNKDKSNSGNDIEKPKLDYKNLCWNINTIFKSDDHWVKELKEFEHDTKELKNYVGKMTKSQTHLNFALDIKEKLDIRMNKLCAYAKLKKDINKNSYKYLDMNEDVSRVYKKYATICSDLELEILKLSDKEYEKLVSKDKISKKYGMYLSDIRRCKKHYLDEKSEDILNGASAVTGLPGQVYELFRNMDKDSTITPSEYASAIESSNREDRKYAYTNELMAYNENINTLSGLLAGQVKKNVFYSTQRGYDSSLDMYLKNDNIDTKIYDRLIETVSNNTSSLHKYISLRKKILKLDKVHNYDMYVPIVKPVDSDITYDKGQHIIYSALSPLGKEYGDIIYKAFNERWIDVYSTEKKVSGGYCLSVYDNHPYILLNYNNTIGSVSTMAHELGHAAYEYLSSKNQNYSNSNPSIFTHEVASTTNEALLYEVLMKHSTNDEQKAYYITKYLDLIKDTLYVQTMYAEFEKIIHETVEQDKNINALVLNDIWSQLLKKYYGSDYEVDNMSMVGWARIPHFYNSFYVYKYATGCSAGVNFAQDILSNGPNNYMSFLKKGSSDYPIKLLKDSGVNLATTQPIENTIKKFDSLLKELEQIIEK